MQLHVIDWDLLLNLKVFSNLNDCVIKGYPALALILSVQHRGQIQSKNTVGLHKLMRNKSNGCVRLVGFVIKSQSLKTWCCLLRLPNSTLQLGYDDQFGMSPWNVWGAQSSAWSDALVMVPCSHQLCKPRQQAECCPKDQPSVVCTAQHLLSKVGDDNLVF